LRIAALNQPFVWAAYYPFLVKNGHKRTAKKWCKQAYPKEGVQQTREDTTICKLFIQYISCRKEMQPHNKTYFKQLICSIGNYGDKNDICFF
jgi:hypothetical protein